MGCELYASMTWLQAAYVRGRPSAVTEQSIRDFLNELVKKHCSWSWISTTISVLRTAFDKLGGMNVTETLHTPKRPHRLPTVLSKGEMLQILRAAPTIRDRLLLGLMYFCGLKVGETCALRWADTDLDHKTIRIEYGRGTRTRLLAIPEDLLPVCRTGVERCRTDDFVFQGKRTGSHLGTRMAELILHKAVDAAGIPKVVSGMTLRHSFAVQCLREGANIRQVQEALGHKNLETTMMYLQYQLPDDAVSPVDALLQRAQSTEPLEQQCCDQRDTAGTPDKGAVNLEAENLDTAELYNTDDLEMPFAAPASDLRSRAADFYQWLKTHIVGRFLATRSSTRLPLRSSSKRGPPQA